MTFFSRGITAATVLVGSSSAFAAGVSGVDLMTYAGYTQMQQSFSDGLSDYVGTMTGYNVGASLLWSLFPTPIAPILGLGVNYFSVTSSADVGGVSASTDFSSISGVVHAGVSFSIPMFKVLLLGNYGLPFQDTFKLSTDSGQPGTSTTYYDGVSDHTFYGITTLVSTSIAPVTSLGVGVTYNIHNMAIDGASGSGNVTGQTADELSINAALVFDL